jgi:hypothetical protein
MSEQNQDSAQERPTTTPPDPTHEATTPPGNAEVDQEDVDKGRDKLEQAGAGH